MISQEPDHYKNEINIVSAQYWTANEFYFEIKMIENGILEYWNIGLIKKDLACNPGDLIYCIGISKFSQKQKINHIPIPLSGIGIADFTDKNQCNL